MPEAAVDLSPTTHLGAIKVVKPRTVYIRGRLAAVIGDQHVCPTGVHGTNAIATASARVRINGQFAARAGDTCACGATIERGAATGVSIA